MTISRNRQADDGSGNFIQILGGNGGTMNNNYPLPKNKQEEYQCTPQS
jgi:hypothetical protein